MEGLVKNGRVVRGFMGVNVQDVTPSLAKEFNMKQEEIAVRVAIDGGGAAQATVWTCDLSHDYVSINADYRS